MSNAETRRGIVWVGFSAGIIASSLAPALTDVGTGLGASIVNNGQ